MTLLSGFPGGIVRWHSWTGGEVAILTASNFQTIKAFILQRGDRQTYCNMYNRNPHYDFGSFDAFLNPDVGQRNINCDPALSDFDELVVRMRDAGGMWSYLTIQLGPHGELLAVVRGSRADAERCFATMLERLQSVADEI